MSDEIFDQSLRQDLPDDFNEPESRWKKFLREKKFILAGIGAVILVLAGLWFFLSGDANNGDLESNDVLLLVKGPSQVTSGNEAEYRIVYTNGESGDLTNVSLELVYPSNFKFVSATPSSTSSSGQRYNLPVLKSGEEGVVKIRGKLSGSAGEEKQIRAKLTYKLSNFNSDFAVEAHASTIILPPNVSLEVTGPVDVIAGQDTTFSVNYANVSNQEFENLAISVAYPEGFQFSSSNPPASKNNNYWTLPKLGIGQSGKVDITGTFIGDPQKEQLVIVELGAVINNNLATLITSSASFKLIPAALSLKINSAPSSHVDLAQNISYNLEYANTGSIGMTNVVIALTLQGTALDLSKLQVSDAVITGNTITWRSATLSNLNLVAPNQSGEITLSVPVKSNLTTNLKNQVIKATANIYSAEITKPIKANDSELKLASKLNLTADVNHVSGPNPTEPGSTSEFAVTLLLTNLSNDVENVEVIASMPLPQSAWKNVVVPESEASRLSYDPISGKIRWKIGKMAAFVGKFSPALSVTFNLQVTPTEADANRSIKLLTGLEATGFDTFIQEELKPSTINEVTTSQF